MKKPPVAIVHYSAPPVIGGVEAVIEAHAHLLAQSEYPVSIIAGRGDQASLPRGADFVPIPEIDSQQYPIRAMSAILEEGQVPADFEPMTRHIEERLTQVLTGFEHVIVHNVLTKRFNLPLTAALHHLLDQHIIRHCIAWCHDIDWASPTSRSKVYPGYPWDLLRTVRDDVTYVTISRRQQSALAEVAGCPVDAIRVIYNGVEPKSLLGLSDEGYALISRLDLLASDLTLLMPVRVTRAKNVEFAMRVVQALRVRGRSPRLIITGPPDPHDNQSMDYFRDLDSLRKQLGVEEQVSFVFESGPDAAVPLWIGLREVGDLFRVSDLLFMPSHREGFGMPVLEAGLVGLPVMCSAIPAAEEIGGSEVTLFDPGADPAQVAEKILTWAEHSPTYRLRRRIRHSYTWDALFRQEIEPLLVLSQNADHAQS